MATKKKTENIQIIQVSRQTLAFRIVGETPLIHNAMSAKARQQLLFPPGKKNAAEKASTLKHEPVPEFRRSVYTSRNPDNPTRIVHKATAFKNALRGAGLDLNGVNKAQLGRLTYLHGDEVSIYGVPQIMCSVVRSADAKKTPDVRSRAIMPEWACEVVVTFTTPILKERMIVDLMASAGMTQGIGDWRQEKGAGNYGSFRLVDEDDADWHRIVAAGGKAAQDAALENPEPYDSETEELLSWFDAEVVQRGFKQHGLKAVK